MVHPADDELRRLRARAYGPAADIEHDPSAAQRLRDLEAALAGRRAGPRDAAHEMTGPPSGTPAQPGHAVVVAGAAQHSKSATRKPRLSRRTKTLWAASVVASAALAAGVATAVTGTGPVSATGSAARVATLDQTTKVKIPVGWLGANASSRVFEFHGATLFTTTRGGLDLAPGDAVSECMYAVPTDRVPVDDLFNEWSWDINSEFHYSGCSAGGFPATVEVPLGNYAPAELREQFPGAKALQFVLEGDQVSVNLDAR